MKILAIKNLPLPEVKIIQFARFLDQRGYFTEYFRKSDLYQYPGFDFFLKNELAQANQSYSKKDTIRGLHFQWNPFMGKLVRVITGSMIDIILDIRKGSPSYGKILMYKMTASLELDHDEIIWVPPGFAHGNLFLEDTIIEYLCTGEYNPNCEAGISPFAEDIDWSLCDQELKNIFDQVSRKTELITIKDRNGFSCKEWKRSENSNNFLYSQMEKMSLY